MLKKKLAAKTHQIDNEIKADKPCDKELIKVVAHEHEKVKETTKEKVESILENFTRTYDEMLREALFELLVHGVKNKTKKNSDESEREDVGAIVDYIREQLSYEVKQLSGKDESVSFGAMT